MTSSGNSINTNISSNQRLRAAHQSKKKKVEKKKGQRGRSIKARYYHYLHCLAATLSTYCNEAELPEGKNQSVSVTLTFFFSRIAFLPPFFSYFPSFLTPSLLSPLFSLLSIQLFVPSLHSAPCLPPTLARSLSPSLHQCFHATTAVHGHVPFTDNTPPPRSIWPPTGQHA